MAVVPWKFSNPYAPTKVPVRGFSLQGHWVEIKQCVEGKVDAHHNTHQKLWDGSYYMASFICSTYFPDSFWRGKTCAELGAGTGLVGIAAWLSGAKSVLTDHDTALSLACDNVSSNVQRMCKEDPSLLAGNISVEALDWCKASSLRGAPFDIILGSEVVYLPELSAPLLQTITSLSGLDTLVYIVYKARGLGESNFWDMLADKGISVTTIDPGFLPKDFADSGYSILTFKPLQ